MNIMDEILQTAQDITKLADAMLKKVKEYEALGGRPNEMPKSEIWKPEVGEDYWYITDTGSTSDACYYRDDFDNEVFDCGNFFKTEKEAEYHANVQKYTNLFRKYVEEHSGPIDWENIKQDKWLVRYDCDAQIIEFDAYSCWKQQGTIYASSEEVLKEAINFVGEENVLKYVLGVKNEIN